MQGCHDVLYFTFFVSSVVFCLDNVASFNVYRALTTEKSIYLPPRSPLTCHSFPNNTHWLTTLFLLTEHIERHCLYCVPTSCRVFACNTVGWMKQRSLGILFEIWVIVCSRDTSNLLFILEVSLIFCTYCSNVYVVTYPCNGAAISC